MIRRFRKRHFHIQVENETGVQKGVRQLILNGKDLGGNFIALEKMKKNNNVLVVMG